MIIDGPKRAKQTLVLAHGAGGAMDTPFLNVVAEGIAARRIRVVRFEFPYMAARREGKKSGGPDRAPVLLDAWRRVVEELGGGQTLVIGGKSMGGRMASMIADEVQARGLLVFGYPFHPPGKPDQLRTGHLQSLKTPALILQGERDPFGTRDEVAGYPLAKTIRVEWIKDGDHSLRPRVKSGTTEAANLERAIDLAVTFISREPDAT